VDVVIFSLSAVGFAYLCSRVHATVFPPRDYRAELVDSLRREAKLWHDTAMEYQKLYMRLYHKKHHDDADWWKQN
jgi:hypothetical protein